jgi:glutamine---fructose-6-phosphate transaminase (isomerizing)
VNVDLFLPDLEAKPAALERLAAALDAGNPWAALSAASRRVLFLGMGSSRYAAGVAALRLRAAGIDAISEYASAELGHPPAADTLVVAISASGESDETVEAVARYRGRSPVVVLTNAPDSSLARAADVIVDLLAGEEASGVACRTFQHTGLLLAALEAHLTGRPADVAGLARRVAAATDDLLARRADWLPPVLAALDGPDGIFVLAPAERLSSAEQSALMIREVPRRLAVACETGDWAHVDVYLAKTLDYRALLLAGSRWDGQALEWLRRRGSTVVAVGRDIPGAVTTVRYAADADADVALHAEVLVAELVAAHLAG